MQTLLTDRPQENIKDLNNDETVLEASGKVHIKINKRLNKRQRVPTWKSNLKRENEKIKCMLSIDEISRLKIFQHGKDRGSCRNIIRQ